MDKDIDFSGNIDASKLTWLASKRLLIMILLGFSSGLPLALTGSALEARYASANVDLMTIGFVTLVGIPYVFKFIWAPLLDRFIPPFLGRRRGWMLLCQFALIVSLVLMSLLKVDTSAELLALLALLTAFFSASQDVAIDAYRTDILLEQERGIGTAYFVGAYRAAMLVSGSIGFILADIIGWQWMYLLMASLMSIGVFASLMAPVEENNTYSPGSLFESFRAPLTEFLSRPVVFGLLALIILYKLGDAFAMKMMTTFFMRGLHFSYTEIGMVNKLFGFFAMLLGVFLGGLGLVRMRLYSALLCFGVAQACSNLMFVWLAVIGKNFLVFVATIMIENICSGMGTAAFLALIMALCNKKYTATQFALLSALAAIPRELLGPVAAMLVKNYGWIFFYEVSFLASIPGIILLYWLRDNILQYSAHTKLESVAVQNIN